MRPKTALPSQTSLLIPLLESLSEAGGAARPSDVYDAVAHRANVGAEARAHKNAQGVNVFERDVRWTRQRAVAKGFINAAERNLWELTDHAKQNLRNIVRGSIVTIFETDAGFAVWCNVEDLAMLVERESVALIMSSPPYPLVRQKEYGNLDVTRWTDWMLRCFEQWSPLLTHQGSVMLNLGPVFEPGVAAQSLYVERLLIRLQDQLGYSLLQRLDWFSPSKLPAPAEYVCVRRIRVKPAVEPVLWLSQRANDAFGDNTAVLQPYSEAQKLAMVQRAGTTEHRPSGHTISASAYIDNGGAIPPSLITASNTSSNSAYQRALRESGHTVHPATMPELVAEFCVKLASRVGDVVMDPFAGSCTVAAVAERLRRRYIVADRSLAYLQSGALRMRTAGYSLTDLLAA
jgi:site-specific DNA-methyltransferase (cytosine-N4-specific)